jgi:hypothetical protein
VTNVRVGQTGVAACLVLGLMAAPLASACVEVKGWETLDDPVRLCAYLSDPGKAEACEQRAYRLGDGLSEQEIDIARQFVLLCSNEYVIGVERESPGAPGRNVLAIKTAIVEGGDAASGYYDRGHVRFLEADGGGWSQRPGGSWSD